MKYALTGAIMLVMSGQALATDPTCRPLSRYSVADVEVDAAPLGDALTNLFAGTYWRVDVAEDVVQAEVGYRNISGPLDGILSNSVKQVSQATGQELATRIDASKCLVVVQKVAQPAAVIAQVQPATPAPAAPAPAGPQPAVLKGGERLSEALEKYAKAHGWDMRWLIDQDFMLDMDLPIPALDVVDGIAYVIRAYQAKGGMSGVTPKFYKGNRVVAIEAMRAEAETH